ncbi:hypothetical protein [Jannaschia sp. CCS1]|uniref:hypothetical protein n=1 Tax=Jannaschia sp. (strain CCS1) TaxID=290400 RepID=UPI000053B4BB|nr:hypothetical protein [Jannaschia sp. CCS1]ABD56579.1 hypothetical protein Jann_3662 [Jannaschia sp. CCS1]
MTNADTHPALYQALRDVELDNAALRLKLARHEFRQMERELKSEHPFKLDVYTTDAPVPPALTIPEIDDVTLPHLPVPMGSIHAGDKANNLPIIGVYDDGLTGATLAAAMLGLMNTQYHSPFARFIFLCSTFEAVPFLGRYDFAFDYVGGAAPAPLLGRLNRRFGATQIRSIATGAVIADYDGD